MTSIGVVGAGVGGLHLSLLLQKRGIPVRLYADRTPEEMRASPRLANTAGHWPNTRSRERELGIAHWDDAIRPIRELNVTVTGDLSARFTAPLELGPMAVDYRITMPRILEDFIERGGDVTYGTITAEQLEELSERHDLVVVSSGRGTMTELFPKIEERSPYQRPQRVLQVSVVDGVVGNAEALNYELVPGVGEVVLFPFHAADGENHTTLYMSAVADGPLPALLNADVAGSDGREALDRVFRTIVQEHFPASSALFDWDAFATVGPEYDIAGALTPTVRRPYAQLGNGRWVLALGDVHTVCDPLLGQGANSASASAFIVGDAVVEDHLAFDELWCRRVADRMWQRSGAAVVFTNELLRVPPAPAVVTLLAAGSVSQDVADYVASFFDVPNTAWNALASPERAEAAVQEVGGEQVLQGVRQALAGMAAA
jgi:2-polyprenyl-6-methoxyphenol hydroxylase-like FAD-dependent oxidoreductase